MLALLRGKFRQFCTDRRANVAVTFALVLIPVAGSVGVAVDYTRAGSVKTAMQNALDSAALAVVKDAAALQSGEITTKANGYFQASFQRSEAKSVNVTAQYDSATRILTLTGAGTLDTYISEVLGFSKLGVAAVSKATLLGQKWPVCVIVTEPVKHHTLLAKNNSKIDFDNCMVQVNTQNWDAVESRDTSYIHSQRGENCFVGDIHYGDVVPPKNPMCEFFPDPFASFAVPTGGACIPGPKPFVTSPGVALQPGTYCGGLTIKHAVTINKGLYVVKDGPLKITAATNITASGVTFALTGKDAAVEIDTPATINLSAANAADAGIYAGFVFFLKNFTGAGGSEILKAKVNASGIIYLAGQELNLKSKAVVTLNPGTIVAGFILPDDATLVLNGTLNTATSAEIALQKAAVTGIPRLMQ